MMRELEYPFDNHFILSKKRAIKRKLLAEDVSRIRKKIAILGGYTTNDIKNCMELFLLNQGIEPEFYESEYNQYYQDAMFGNPVLDAFEPDIIYVCTSIRNIKRFPLITDDCAAVASLLDSQMTEFVGVWENLAKKYKCPIIQNNMELPFFRLMGNQDAADIHGRVNFVTRLNLKFYEYAQAHENFYICDINYISADYGLKEWSDPFYWHMYKYAVNMNAVPYLAFQVANMIKSMFGKNKKGLVLDLDNTLWGGVVGEDGVDNIVLGQEEPLGQVYSEFQEYIKLHKDMGIILAVDSKNEETNALAGLNHVDSLLKPDDFVQIMANWDTKERNFTKIAEEINILPESLVFVDDNPAERHIVREQLHGVSAPEIGEPHQYIQNIDRNGYFEVTRLCADDANRNAMYRENQKRKAYEASFTDYYTYLISLKMRAAIRPFASVYMARIAQLTNKSNQFNLTTRRYTQAEIEAAAADDTYITRYGKLVDKFGNNGVVSVVIGHLIEGACHIDLWIMSCRVLKREMEYAMMDELVNACKSKEIGKIIGYYYPTKKNGMVRDFYAQMGFRKVCSDKDGNTKWEFEIPLNYQNKTDVIEVER